MDAFSGMGAGRSPCPEDALANAKLCSITFLRACLLMVAGGAELARCAHGLRSVLIAQMLSVQFFAIVCATVFATDVATIACCYCF